MSVDPRPRPPHPARGGPGTGGRRATPTTGTQRRAGRPRTPEPVDGRPAAPTGGLAAVVTHGLGLLGRRHVPLGREVVRGVVERLRHFAVDTPDPALRAAVHVACSHLSAGNLDEAHDALRTAASLLGPTHG